MWGGGGDIRIKEDQKVRLAGDRTARGGASADKPRDRSVPAGLAGLARDCCPYLRAVGTQRRF